MYKNASQQQAGGAAPPPPSGGGGNGEAKQGDVIDAEYVDADGDAKKG
jgi:hypothetical protein